MEDNMKTGNLALALVFLALFAGMALGVGLDIARTEVVEVEKIVNQTVPVEVEVLVEKDFNAYKDEAVNLCYAEFAEDIKLDKYEELILFDISDEWNIVFDGNTTISIDKLKFRRFDTLTDKRNTYTRACTVFLEEGEEAEITLV
jgi:hypothetical protein